MTIVDLGKERSFLVAKKTFEDMFTFEGKEGYELSWISITEKGILVKWKEKK